MRRRNMVTAISNVNKLSETQLVATGAADGSICVLSMDTNAVVTTFKVEAVVVHEG